MKRVVEWYGEQVAQVREQIAASRRSLIPYAPLGLAEAIMNCAELNLRRSRRLPQFRGSIAHWRRRISSEYQSNGLEVAA